MIYFIFTSNNHNLKALAIITNPIIINLIKDLYTWVQFFNYEFISALILIFKY